MTFAPNPLAAAKEARAWREVIAPTQQVRREGRPRLSRQAAGMSLNSAGLRESYGLPLCLTCCLS